MQFSKRTSLLDWVQVICSWMLQRHYFYIEGSKNVCMYWPVNSSWLNDCTGKTPYWFPWSCIVLYHDSYKLLAFFLWTTMHYHMFILLFLSLYLKWDTTLVLLSLILRNIASFSPGLAKHYRFSNMQLQESFLHILHSVKTWHQVPENLQYYFRRQREVIGLQTLCTAD